MMGGPPSKSAVFIDNGVESRGKENAASKKYGANIKSAAGAIRIERIDLSSGDYGFNGGKWRAWRDCSAADAVPRRTRWSIGREFESSYQ